MLNEPKPLGTVVLMRADAPSFYKALGVCREAPAPFDGGHRRESEIMSRMNSSIDIGRIRVS